MSVSSRLRQLLDRVKPQIFPPLSSQNILATFRNRDIIVHLKNLGVPQLKNHLVWIPPEEFDNVELLGEGAFAKVYKGTAKGHVFAMKELGQSMVQELVLNALLLSSRNGVVNIYGLTKNLQTKKYLMVMDYADGGSLNDLESPISYDWNTVTNFAHTLAVCLHYIHSEGLMHNDLHPGNIVLFRNTLKLVDIGLSSSVEDICHLQGVYGRKDYLPPEVFDKGSSKRTPASDVYCFATVLWQMVTGIPPKGNAAFAIKNGSRGLREELIPGAPEWFNGLLEDCWNPIPEMRPTMLEVERRLSSQLSLMRRWWWWWSSLVARLVSRSSPLLSSLSLLLPLSLLLSLSFLFLSSTKIESTGSLLWSWWVLLPFFSFMFLSTMLFFSCSSRSWTGSLILSLVMTFLWSLLLFLFIFFLSSPSLSSSSLTSCLLVVTWILFIWVLLWMLWWCWLLLLPSLPSLPLRLSSFLSSQWFQTGESQNRNFTKKAIKHRFTPDTLWFIAKRYTTYKGELASSASGSTSGSGSSSSTRSKHNSLEELRLMNEIE